MTNIIFLNKRVTTKYAQKNDGLTVCFEHVLILSSFGTESNSIDSVETILLKGMLVLMWRGFTDLAKASRVVRFSFNFTDS